MAIKLGDLGPRLIDRQYGLVFVEKGDLFRQPIDDVLPQVDKGHWLSGCQIKACQDRRRRSGFDALATSQRLT